MAAAGIKYAAGFNPAGLVAVAERLPVAVGDLRGRSPHRG